MYIYVSKVKQYCFQFLVRSPRDEKSHNSHWGHIWVGVIGMIINCNQWQNHDLQPAQRIA